jgi:hypothetical protein
LKTIFDGSYPEEDFRDVNVTIEFPMEPQNYPGIWVQFDDGEDLERAGIDHREIVIDDLGNQRQVTRWRFGGSLALTVAALSSQERDRLYDEVVRVLAFSGLDISSAGQFKQLIENNDLIGINLNYDVLTPSGDDASPGTPWNTAEIIYEKTVSMALIGEFVSDAVTNALYPLSRVIVSGYEDQDFPPDLPVIDPQSNVPYQPGQWI